MWWWGGKKNEQSVSIHIQPSLLFHPCHTCLHNLPVKPGLQTWHFYRIFLMKNQGRIYNNVDNCLIFERSTFLDLYSLREISRVFLEGWSQHNDSDFQSGELCSIKQNCIRLQMLISASCPRSQLLAVFTTRVIRSCPFLGVLFEWLHRCSSLLHNHKMAAAILCLLFAKDSTAEFWYNHSGIASWFSECQSSLSFQGL